MGSRARHLPLLVLGLLLAGPAHGAGLTFLDPGARSLARGGAIVAGVDDATAVFLNPARLVDDHAYGVTGALTLALLEHGFDRAGVDSTGAPYAPVAESGPPGLLPLLAAKGSFGLEDWAFGLALHAPNAYGTREFPTDGAQRYQLVDTDIQLFTTSVAVAWRPLPELSVGLALELVTLLRARIGMVVDGYWLQTTHADSGPYDTLAHIDVADPARFDVTLGLAWRPRDWLEVGLSARLLPVAFAADGAWTPRFLGEDIARLHEGGQLSVTESGVHLGLTLPPIVRLGVRLVGRDTPEAAPWGDLELDLVYEAWSVYERLDVRFDGALALAAAENPLPLHPLDMPRAYRDTVSVRLGGSVRPGLEWLDLSAGAFYESAAAPPATTTVDTAAGHRLGFGIGATFQVGPVALTAAWVHAFELPVDVTEGQTDIVQQRPASPCVRPYDGSACTPRGVPSGPAVGAGRYTAGVDLVSFGASLAL